MRAARQEQSPTSGQLTLTRERLLYRREHFKHLNPAAGAQAQGQFSDNLPRASASGEQGQQSTARRRGEELLGARRRGRGRGGLGHYWAAQWHLARAVGKRFQGCRAKHLCSYLANLCTIL